MSDYEQEVPWATREHSARAFASQIRFRVAYAERELRDAPIALAQLEARWARGEIPWAGVEGGSRRIRQAEVRMREAKALAIELKIELETTEHG